MPRVEAIGMTKRFDALLALDDVSFRLEPGTFHAILGENGAGKSTLVKCIMGYYKPDAGRLLLNGVQHDINNPRQALALGLGLVYQHFTMVPNMTATENLVLGQTHAPRTINWTAERARIESFQQKMPFRVDLDARVASLSAGEKQKLEILKHLYLDHRVMILDEPTSVLTPSEADQVLGMLRDLTEAHRLSVVLITHKFREVLAFAEEVTVLRGGRGVGVGKVADLREADLAGLMFGRGTVFASADRNEAKVGKVALEIRSLSTLNDKGITACNAISLAVHKGEIIGVAGVAGNGQRELVEVLAGQRQIEAGEVRVAGVHYNRGRKQMRRHGVHLLTEEPLQNSCVRGMSVAENLSFRIFDDRSNTQLGCFVRRSALRRYAGALIQRYDIRPPVPDARLDTLSGGNIQRTVLARELSGAVSVLIAQNPCVGLDFSATSEIHSQIITARNRGAAILLFSEDLDELLEVADRIVVMFEGRIVYETPRAVADIETIGLYMVGHRSERDDSWAPNA